MNKKHGAHAMEIELPRLSSREVHAKKAKAEAKAKE